MTETNSEVVKRLLKQGGYALIAGGHLAEMNINHPQIIIWDDTVQEFRHKTIPTNTRCICFSKWISHTNVSRFRNAAKQLNIPIFPMLNKNEIRDITNEIIHSEIIETKKEGEIELVNNEPGTIIPVDDGKHYLVAEDIMRKPKRGEVKNFIIDSDVDFTKPYIREAERLYEIAKRKGIKTTLNSLAQGIRVQALKKRNGKKETRSATITTTNKQIEIHNSDFTEAKKLLTDAKAAIDLLLDFIPKLEKEVQSSRKRMDKIKTFLGDI